MFFETGLSMSDVRKINISLIIKTLCQNPIPRCELAKKLNLTRAAITLIIDGLIKDNILFEEPSNKESDNNVYKRNIHINFNYAFVLGISIDTNYVGVGISNLNNEILGKKTIPFNKTNSINEIVKQITEFVNQLKNECAISHDQILGCGMCVSENILFNNKFDIEGLAQEIETVLNTQITFKNMTEGLSLYEYGLRPDINSLFLIRYTNDLFTSFVLNNQLLNHNENSKGISHSIIYDSDRSCPVCKKKGCAYNLVSGEVLATKINNIYSKENTPNLYSSLGKDASNPGKQALGNVFWLTDKSVIDIIKEASKNIAILINNIYEIFSPQSIVFTGRMIENEVFLQSLYNELSNILPEKILKILDTGYIATSNHYVVGCSLAIDKFFMNARSL